jgi:hypothetical protein
MSTPQQAPVRPGGVLNTLADAGRAVQGVDIGEAIKGAVEPVARMAKVYDETMPEEGWKKALAEKGFGLTYGPSIRKAVADAMRAGQSYLKPSSYPATGPGGGQPAAPAAPISGLRSADRYNGSQSGPGADRMQPFMLPAAYAAAMSGGGGGGFFAPQAPGPVAPVSSPYDYFQNVQTREEVLRQLLGEEWYA